MAKTFYVTTPIYYPSGKPHIGTCYTNIVADLYARWHEILGEDIFYTTGTDEHGQKMEKCAQEASLTPQEYVDSMVPHFKDMFDQYGFLYNKFVRTTDKNHKKFCQEILKKVYDKGDVYKGKYEGWYCVSCETYYTEKDVLDKKCPLHGRPVEWMSEETYFFKMSKYQDRVIKYLEQKSYICPQSRQDNIIKRMKESVRDLSISRSKLKWGIILPFDKSHTSFVWFDALLNYVSSTNSKSKSKFWPANLHITSHDIMWHHSVIWLSMLFSAGIKPPKKLLVHGFIKGEGGLKMSKSLGNVVDPMVLLETFPSDSVRYFLLREIPLGNDGEFSHQALLDRHNNELVKDLGNLHSRTLSMVEKYFDGKIPVSTKKTVVKSCDVKKIKNYIDNFEPHNALNEIWRFIHQCNKYINDEKPWELVKSDKKRLETILYNLTESQRFLSILLYPFVPEASKEIRSSLGLKGVGSYKELKFGLLTTRTIKRKGHLFSTIEKVKKMEEKKEDYLSFDDLGKVSLRAGKVLSVKKHPDADKLYILEVDTGDKKRTIVSGLVQHYKESELKGRTVVVVTNLQPKKLRGILSEGMLLAADLEGIPHLLGIDGKVKPGSHVK
jgi:methionyl-tRNA synthetase